MTIRPKRWLVLLLLGALCACAGVTQPAAVAADQSADPESAAPAAAGDLLTLRGERQVEAFRNQLALAATRTVRAGDRALPLPAAAIPMAEEAVRLDDGDRRIGIDVLFAEYRTAGLIVVKDGAVAYERYGFGNTRDTRWISFSVAKSIVAMLIGAAIEDGYIDSIDDPVVAYLPRLRNSAYEGATIRHLLQMASGVTWNEDYADPESDVASADYATLALYEHLRNKPRLAPPGARFNYNTAETNLAGTLLRSAIGNNLSVYLEQKIWQPFGMEADAYWNLTEPGGGEFGGCCINATLRDYARLGLFALADGRLADGTRVLPEGYMQASVAPSPAYAGYGYFWWLSDGPAFSAQGIFGQMIYVNPETNLVVAVHSAWPAADEPSAWARLERLFAAIEQALAEPGQAPAS
ncbi:MAG: serine hydrolase [Pseudomonadota bacterium]